MFASRHVCLPPRWTFVIYFIAISFVGIVWQPEMSRPLSTEDSLVARRVFWIQGITSAGRAVIPMFWGCAAFAWTHLPSYTGAYAADGQSAVPEMLGQILPVGVAGLLLAGMFAAFMSTHDSYLLAGSGVIVRDVMSPIKAMLAGSAQSRGTDDTWGGLSSEREIYWTRFCVIVLALLLALFGLVVLRRRPGLGRACIGLSLALLYLLSPPVLGYWLVRRVRGGGLTPRSPHAALPSTPSSSNTSASSGRSRRRRRLATMSRYPESSASSASNAPRPRASASSGSFCFR